jgi:hypothetical protein
MIKSTCVQSSDYNPYTPALPAQWFFIMPIQKTLLHCTNTSRYPICTLNDMKMTFGHLKRTFGDPNLTFGNLQCNFNELHFIFGDLNSTSGDHNIAFGNPHWASSGHRFTFETSMD